MSNVLITGGTGLIGKRLTGILLEKGYNVSFLSRRSNNSGSVKVYKWHLKNKKIESGAIENADYIIHLAGAGIADKRWTNKRKKEIISSRVESSNLLIEKIKSSNNKPKVFISASAIGYYGMATSEKIFNENDKAGSDFLGECCLLWEGASEPVGGVGIRRVVIRTGLVLSDKGGALPKFILPSKYYIDGTLGSGKQYMPWIHIDDLCNIYIKAIEDGFMQGTYNAVAPEHITNKDFNTELRKVIKKKAIFPKTPEFLLKIVLGEMADMLTKGSRVSSKKILATGLKFRFSELKDALKDLIKKDEK